MENTLPEKSLTADKARSGGRSIWHHLLLLLLALLYDLGVLGMVGAEVFSNDRSKASWQAAVTMLLGGAFVAVYIISMLLLTGKRRQAAVLFLGICPLLLILIFGWLVMQ